MRRISSSSSFLCDPIAVRVLTPSAGIAPAPAGAAAPPPADRELLPFLRGRDCADATPAPDVSPEDVPASHVRLGAADCWAPPTGSGAGSILEEVIL
mmetsp:Transcript_68835/g.188951  ORF Transcript_68835/g.188951 Transcript_68835/m.188951 type:complete len:97 (-) Transcript_68835:134-424(-)|eukprot:5302758-Prymnesium_polylepis.1